MHPSIYLFNLFLVIILNTLQACCFNRGVQQDLSRQTPSYTVSLRSDNQTGYFEEQSIPIHILFTSEDEYIKNNGMGFRIKNISIEGIAGHLETEDGDLLGDGYDFVYKDDGYPLFFIPAVDEDSGHCTITFDTLLIDKYGNEAAESTHKLATYGLYIWYKKAIQKSIQEQEEETKFSETLKPLSEDYSNSKLPVTTVSLEDTGYPFQDPGFFSRVICDENIALTLGGDHLTGDEAWIIEDWHFEGGVTGSLHDASSSHELTRPLKLQAGTIYIDCSLAIENLSGSPIVVLTIVHPDSRKETVQVDISTIVLLILEDKLAEYKTLLSDLIYTTTDPDIRDKTIKASKQILAKMKNLLTQEEEKTKIESIIKDYDAFLKENQDRFENAVRASEILSIANTAIRNSFVFEKDKYMPAWREYDRQEITGFINAVDQDPRLFDHLSTTIKEIREQFEVIDMHFYEDDE